MSALLLKEKVQILRKKGFSLSEISDKLGVSKGTVSLWCSHVIISSVGLKFLKTKETKSRERGLKAIKEIRDLKQQNIEKQAKKVISSIHFKKDDYKLLCAFMYWCEGSKDKSSALVFMNSDPHLVQSFLFLLRKSFLIDEKKFRVCLHLHEYHNVKQMIRFWSKTTKISSKQFLKPYMKINTGKRMSAGYNGCASVRYYDNHLKNELIAIFREFFHQYLGV